MGDRDERGDDWAGVESGPVDPDFFGRERRMHLRAHEYWQSLLSGRAMPTLHDFDPAQLADCSPNSVLIDWPNAPPGPGIAFVGPALQTEAGLPDARPERGDIADGTLLAQLLRHLPEIVAARAPIGFEAEFVGRGGAPTLYRGILLPFSADGRHIAAIYGVINWRLLQMLSLGAELAAAVGSALALTPHAPMVSPWDAVPAPVALPAPTLEQRLAIARTRAALTLADRARRPGTLHAALGAAHDLLLACRAEGGTDGPAAIVHTVFGAEPSDRDRDRYIDALAHADRLRLGPGLLASLLDRHRRGLAGVATAERRARADAAPSGHAAGGHIALAPLSMDFLLGFGRRPAAPEEPAPLRAVG